MLRHLREDIDVTLDERRLCDYTERMAVLLQHPQHLTGDAELALSRLPGIGVDAEHQRLALIALFLQLIAQLCSRVGLVEEFCFEIEAGREAQVGMGGTRKAV